MTALTVAGGKHVRERGEEEVRWHRGIGRYPVFTDRSGRRRRLVRTASVAVAVVLIAIVVLVVTTAFGPVHHTPPAWPAR